MEGYSITEAASILGVPTERVWELLARGVLAGTPEGEAGMRVFLQPRPAPAPVIAEPLRPNGEGGSGEPQRELSPFRELLTEFRNLTERYGQALLALGESRGEVASLRSRVDLLEARMDLRLPMSSGPMAAEPTTAAPPPWTVPEVAPVETATVEAVPEPSAPEPAASEPPAEAEHATREHVPAEDDEERRRRRRGQRRATESFAEALARAEDPSRPELPGAAETAAALAALRGDAVHEGEHAAEAVLPRELPAAESMPMPDERPRREGETVATTTADAAARVEPPETPAEPRAPAEPPVVQAPAEPEPPEEVAVAVAPQLEEPISDEVIEEVTAGAALEPVLEEDAEVPATASVVESGETEDAAAAVEPEPPAEPEPATEAEPPAEAEPAAEPEPAAELEAIAWDPERYTVDIVEPDWYADVEADEFAAAPEVGVEDRAAAAVETAAVEEPAKAEEPAEPEESAADVSREPVEEVTPEPVTDRPEESAPSDAEPATASAELPPPVPAEPDAAEPEETMLWFGRAPETTAPPEATTPPERPAAAGQVDDGAEEMEVVGVARRSPTAPMPGSKELDDALAALEAVAAPSPPEVEEAGDDEWPPPVGADVTDVTDEADVTDALETPEQDDAHTAGMESGHAGDVDAVRGQPAGLLPSVRPAPTPASRAYRRLRRIFPG